jgi:membrane-associated phospholipid phosphatase
MDTQWGLTWNIALQQLSPALDGLMRALSFLGQDDFFMIIIPFVYWCLNATWGVRFISVLILSDYTNGLFKWLFHAPRPYWIDARVKALASEPSYGLPSGHAQAALTVWGFAAYTLKKRWAWIAAAILILAISISRIYLGVHFPTDVFAGWIIGFIILIVFLWLEPRVVRWLAPKPIGVQILTAFLASMVMLILIVIVQAMIASVIDPASWSALAGPIDPRNPEGPVSDAAIVFGVGAGFVLMRRYAHFDARGPWLKRIARFALGVAMLLALRFGLGAIFPHDTSVIAMIFRYIRYTLMLLWAMWLAPWVFIKLKLAEPAA